MASVITLTTDFGLTGTYVAAMKAVILGINPEVALVDVCHTISPQNVLQGAFAIETVYEYFPPGTIHVVVVDPGVGTGRRGVILRTPRADFVAPDNGVLSYVVRRFSHSAWKQQRRSAIDVPEELEAVHLTKPEFWRSPVSPTFHGRDIFAPVAARLSMGHQPSEFGRRIRRLTVLPLPRPASTADGELTGQVLEVDSFGNLITDIRAEDMPTGKVSLTVTLGDRRIRGLVSTYAEGEGLVALIGSSGHLEIAVRNASAAASLKAHAGDKVTVRVSPP